MTVISSYDQIAGLTDNHILGDIDFIQSRVIFHGKNNLMIAPFTTDTQKIRLNQANITFHGDNNLIFMNLSNRDYIINLDMYNNSFCHIGMNNLFNGLITMQCSERCNIFIGDDCMFSHGIWVRTSDVHLIYDIKSRSRINPSKSVFIGDHVWVGQDARVWKGTHIGSGAILGASAFSAGKRISSNTAWGGNPAKQIKDGVFFTAHVAHSFTDKMTKQAEKYMSGEYIYKYYENETISFVDFENKIKSLSTLSKKAEYLVDFNIKKTKNRFFI